MKNTDYFEMKRVIVQKRERIEVAGRWEEDPQFLRTQKMKFDPKGKDSWQTVERSTCILCPLYSIKIK